MTVDEITDYYIEHSKATLTPDNSLGLPVIEAWVGTDSGDKVIISGRIHNHPKYPLGAKLRTSMIQGYIAKAGRVYVTTKNSMYELGMPCQYLSSDSQKPHTNPGEKQREKLTYWS